MAQIDQIFTIHHIDGKPPKIAESGDKNSAGKQQAAAKACLYGKAPWPKGVDAIQVLSATRGALTTVFYADHVASMAAAERNAAEEAAKTAAEAAEPPAAPEPPAEPEPAE